MTLDELLECNSVDLLCYFFFIFVYPQLLWNSGHFWHKPSTALYSKMPYERYILVVFFWIVFLYNKQLTTNSKNNNKKYDISPDVLEQKF